MPADSLKVEKSFQKGLKKLPLPIHKRAITALEKIQDNPLIGARLHGELGEYFKYRIGDYRIVYTFDAKKSEVIIVKIEHRQGVYK